MRNCNTRFKIGVVFLVSVLAACSPLKEKALAPQLVEMDIVDPDLASQFSDGPDHNVVGSLSLEVQQDMVSGKSTVYGMATFHEPISKNILFDKFRTNVLSKNIYKPKPVEQPCGIPGFPDCTTPPTDPPSNPDQPCGIPGFPDCPAVPGAPSSPPATNTGDQACGIPGFPDCPTSNLTLTNNKFPQEEK